MRSEWTKKRLVFWILAGCVASARIFAESGNSEKTTELTAVLQSAAPLFEKARACQQLGEIGDKTAVPALARLLSDEHLSAYARSGLEGIPDPSAAEALRTALGTVKGSLLAGVINSIGALRDAQAVGALRPLAEDPGSGVAKEALLALGRIDTAESIVIVRRALNSGPQATRADAAAASLLAAQKQLSEGHARLALKLDDEVRDAGVPAVYRAAATRGAILAHQSDRVPFLMRQLRSQEPIIRNAALLAIREIPGPALAEALNTEIEKAPPELKLQLISALGDCHNAKSLQLLEANATSNEPQCRLAALKVLSNIGSPGEAGVLIKVLLENRNPAEAELAKGGLERLEDHSIGNLVLESLQTAREAGGRVQLIGLLDARGATNAVAELIKQAADPDETVSVAALRALGSLAGAGETPALIALTKACKTQPRRDAAENAICRAAANNGNAAAAGEAVLAELDASTDSVEKNSWVRILASLGYAKALPALETAMNDANESVAANAIENLGRWPDPAPVEALLAVVDSGANPQSRQRALGSAIELAAVAVDEHQRPDDLVLAWLKRASPAAQSVAERRQIISVLGRLKRVESFRLLSPWLDQPELQAEAGVALLQIAPALVDCEDSIAVKHALETMVATAKTASIREQAAKLAQSIHR